MLYSVAWRNGPPRSLTDLHTTFQELSMLAAAQHLSPSDRRRLNEHLDGCNACSEFYQDMMGLAGAVATLEPEASSGLRKRKHLALVPSPPPAVTETQRAGRRLNWRHIVLASVVCFACGWACARLLAAHVMPHTAHAAATASETDKHLHAPSTLPEGQGQLQRELRPTPQGHVPRS